MTSTPSSTNAGNPSAPPGSGVSGGAGQFGPTTTNAPSVSITPSLNSDSTATARTRPRLCSTADALRVPNSIANNAIANATYSALSPHGGGVNSLARVSMP